MQEYICLYTPPGIEDRSKLHLHSKKSAGRICFRHVWSIELDGIERRRIKRASQDAISFCEQKNLEADKSST